MYDFLPKSDSLSKDLELLIEKKVSSNIPKSKINTVIESLNLLLNGNVKKYSFNNIETISDYTENCNNDIEFQKLLSKINEKQNGRQITGRYYTPQDVTEYIIGNTFVTRLDTSVSSIYTVDECLLKCKSSPILNHLLYDVSLFDPTCGAGEFLVAALNLKVSLLTESSDSAFLKILNSIYGNDINASSIEITKIRLYFSILPYINNYDNLFKVSEILNKNLSIQDFLKTNTTSKKSDDILKFDIIIGNPPYVEDSKVLPKEERKYGNIYANILDISSHLLNKNGVMGFVLPLSYVSTVRMHKIRKLLDYKTPKQFLLNYADRPDCLFSGVHQKLTLLIATNYSDTTEHYTSGYNYWYKNERKSLLSEKKLILNPCNLDSFIPKIDNEIEISLFNKLYTTTENTFTSLVDNTSKKNIFLNMRACFWIKAFSFNPGSKEYKAFHYSEEEIPYMLCLLNSNIFFFYWIVTSDCWHITNKELSTFKVITKNVNFKKFKSLAKKLESKLEETKEYIGTKQTEYAYKHKFCKKEIDQIDKSIADIYNLTKEELNYLKNFHLRYRMSEK